MRAQKWFFPAIPILLVIACASPSGRTLSDLTFTQISAINSKGAQQEQLLMQLLTQMGRATLKGYWDYTVGPEDLLKISFLGFDELNREIRVNGQREITLTCARTSNI